jgi:chromate transporter
MGARAVIEVATAFLRLGCTAFGGPFAHLGYFRAEFVERRRWLTEPAWTDTVAMCQVLPGPSSTQTAFALGLRRAGLAGGIAAWAAFTLPSATVMAAAGAGVVTVGATEGSMGWMAGLRALAVAVVARAAWGMARASLRRPAAWFGALACALAVLVAARSASSTIAVFAQPAVIVVAAVVAMVAGRGDASRAEAIPVVRAPDPIAVPRSASVLALVAFLALLALAVFAPLAPPMARAGAASYGAGALVFGGGHVVLPLIERPFVERGWLDASTVITGYALAQAVPGPMFTMATFLGAALGQPHGGAASAWGAAFLTVAVFLPGLLLVVAVEPAWRRLRALPGLSAAVGGASIAVTGVLVAALVDPVLPAGITDLRSAAIAIAALVLLGMRRVPVPAVVIAAAAAGQLLGA